MTVSAKLRVEQRWLARISSLRRRNGRLKPDRGKRFATPLRFLRGLSRKLFARARVTAIAQVRANSHRQHPQRKRTEQHATNQPAPRAKPRQQREYHKPDS